MHRAHLSYLFALTSFSSIAFAQSLPAPTTFTTEWRMTGATAEFLDKVGGLGTIEYGDGAGGATSTIDSFTTTTAAGIPDIGGVDTPILHFGRHVPATTGYQIRPMTLVDPMQFTMVWDLFLETGNPDGYQGLWNGSGTNANDAELHLEITTGGFWHDQNGYNGCGGQSVGAGSWQLGQWFRLVYVNDYQGCGAGTAKIFVNGQLVVTDTTVDYIYPGTDPTLASWWLSDQNGDVTEGFMANFAFSDTLLTDAEVLALGAPDAGGIFSFGGPIGMSYCGPAIPNSSNFPGLLEATGSTSVLASDVTLTATQLPPGQFGYFLAGQTQGFFVPPGSQGFICLAGNIGRYNAVADIIQGPSGSLALNLGSIPVNPPTAVVPGDTWSFQCWHRDSNPGTTSNFTNGVEILFQ